MARKLRQALPVVLPTLGVALMIGAVLSGTSVLWKVALILLGLLLTEAGIWRLADPMLPEDRKYEALRAEAEHLVVLVRQLNTVAVALDEGEREGPRFAMEELQTEMHRSIDRMVSYAGKTREEMAPRRGAPGLPEDGAG